MNARFGIVVGWLAAGHALLFALYWLLLRVPESNLLMLGGSGAIVVALIVLAGWIEGSASRMLTGEPVPPGKAAMVHAMRSGVRSVVPFIGAVVVFVAAWWLVGRLDLWLDAHRGEIDAWLMARFGWADASRLHGAAAWLLAFLRYSVGLSLALALFAEASRGPVRSFPSRWLQSSFSPLRLLQLTALLLLFFWLPWRVVYWRPGWLLP